LPSTRNLGFIGTVNRGFAETSGDVVLLNSDTIVTHGWLAKMVACAESDPRIATITPFSNNAEICSYPQMCGTIRGRRTAMPDWPIARSNSPLAASIATFRLPSGFACTFGGRRSKR
jgi:GT2 family glycosyltransferase